MKYQKPIALISGLVLALSLPVSSALADTATVCAEKSANVRAGAGANHAVIGWAMKGDVLDVLGTEGNWTKVQLKNGKTGYVHTSMLNVGAPTGVSKTITATKSANVRVGAGTNHAVIGWAMKGDTVTVLETSGSWSKVQLKNGKVGYIHTSMLDGSVSTGSAAVSTANAVIATKYASSTVNLRDAKDGKVIASLKSGAPVTVVARDGDWYQVQVGGKTGYVHANYVQEGTSAQTTGDVHLRNGAGVNNAAVRVLKKGTPVIVLGKSGKWLRVQAEGVVGYIHSAYCSK